MSEPLSANGTAPGDALQRDERGLYDPEPRALDPATNGFRWCHECEAVVDLSKPHVCGLGSEFTESLLCALAFDHQRDRIALQVAQVDPFAPLACWGCAFCEFAT